MRKPSGLGAGGAAGTLWGDSTRCPALRLLRLRRSGWPRLHVGRSASRDRLGGKVLRVLSRGGDRASRGKMEKTLEVREEKTGTRRPKQEMDLKLERFSDFCLYGE